MTKLQRVLPVFALLLYILAVTAGLYEGGFWAAIGIAGALILYLATGIVDKHIPKPQRDFTILAAIALGVMAVLNLQSFRTNISWREWVRLASIFLPLLLLTSPAITSRISSPKFFPVLAVVMVLAALGLSLELYLQGPLVSMLGAEKSALIRYNRGFSYIAILSFPVMAALWMSKRRWLIIPFLLVLFVPASLTESRSAKLALILALPAMAVAYVWPVWAGRLLALGPVLALGWPFAAQWVFVMHQDWLPRLPDSWRARMEIWDYMSYRILEHPLLGWGLGTGSSLPFHDPHGIYYVFTDMPASHPHNVVTQLWTELGVPGLMLGLAFAFLTLWKASRLDKRIAPFAIGAWVTSLCLCLTAYNFWTDSLFACFAMTGMAFGMVKTEIRKRRG